MHVHTYVSPRLAGVLRKCSTMGWGKGLRPPGGGVLLWGWSGGEGAASSWGGVGGLRGINFLKMHWNKQKGTKCIMFLVRTEITYPSFCLSTFLAFSLKCLLKIDKTDPTRKN